MRSIRCLECGASYDVSYLRLYWGDWPWPAWIMQHWYAHFAQPRSAPGSMWLQYKKWLYGHRLRLPLITGVATVVPMTCILLLTGPPMHISPAYLLFRALSLILLIAGFIGFYLAFQFVDYLKALCRSCGYERHAESNPSAQCSECGSPWNLIGATKVMSYRKRPFILAASVTAVIIGFTLISGGMLHDLPQRYASTDALIRIVLNHRGPSHRMVPEWRELRGSRVLTDAQRDHLIDGMLDRRDSGVWHVGFAESWFADQVLNGLLTDTQRERYFSGMAIFSLDGPTCLRLGEEATFAIDVDYRHGAIGIGEAHVYFGGFRIDSTSAPINRADVSVNLRDFGRRIRQQLAYAPTRTPIEPDVTFAAESPGDITVAADLWIVIHPSRHGSAPIAWPDDGAPQLDEETVIWKQRVMLKRHVMVLAE